MITETGDGERVVVEPPVRLTVLAALAAVLLVGAVAAADAAGRVLVVPGVLLALGWVVRDRVAGPLVLADERGLELLSGWRRVGAPWHAVVSLRVVKDRRTRVLEVDLGDTVVALSGTRLGRDPQDVAEDLQRLRTASGTSSGRSS